MIRYLDPWGNQGTRKKGLVPNTLASQPVLKGLLYSKKGSGLVFRGSEKPKHLEPKALKTQSVQSILHGILRPPGPRVKGLGVRVPG